MIITAITWTPNPAYTSNGVLFSALVKNQGSAATPDGTVLRVGFSVDGGASYTYSSTDTTALAAGAVVLLTANGGSSPGGNWPAVPGAHSVVGHVDDVDRILESNEGNNFYTTNISVVTAGSPRISRLTVQAGGNVTLIFDAYVGKTYRVQFKTNLADAAWIALGADITANAASVSVPDNGGGNGLRFYRVWLLN